jgi:BirA family biotin operon repressor/biotin-[acetyl-CoA-carboxylase] ligase
MTEQSPFSWDDESATAIARLRMLLERQGRRWEAPIEHHSCLGSTNQRLRDLARESAPDGSIVIADTQTAGHGRHGRDWLSPRGSLFASLLLRKRCAHEQPGWIPLTGGVAVAWALMRFGVETRLKWPNDVLVGGRKIAGVLAESIMHRRKIDAVVVGVGVNVNLMENDVPPALAEKVTSLRRETGVQHEVLDVAAAVLAGMAEWYDALEREEIIRIHAEWRRLCAAWWGRTVEVEIGDDRMHGVIEDLDDQGALVLRKSDGSTARLLSGEIRGLTLADEGKS